MSRLVAQILLCLLMFPLAVVCYCSTVLTLEDRGPWFSNSSSLFTSAGAITWTFVAVYWILLWRKSVRWTTKRRLVPIIAAIAGLAIAAIGHVTLGPSGDREAHLILLGIVIPTLWLIATVYFWRETPAERTERLRKSGRASVSCPVCGYNLTGLGEARCPECGTKFSLDELLAAQPAQAVGEIE